ncbi:MAG: cytochrome c [Pseudomonadota bacterium]
MRNAPFHFRPVHLLLAAAAGCLAMTACASGEDSLLPEAQDSFAVAPQGQPAELELNRLAPEYAAAEKDVYLLHCSGCHKIDGSGQPGFVPSLHDDLQQLVASPAGREFIIRVPGVAQSQLSDERLADLMNWIVERYAGAELPEGFVAYEASEIGCLRSNPISNTLEVKAAILDEGKDAIIPEFTSSDSIAGGNCG